MNHIKKLMALVGLLVLCLYAQNAHASACACTSFSNGTVLTVNDQSNFTNGSNQFNGIYVTGSGIITNLQSVGTASLSGFASNQDSTITSGHKLTITGPTSGGGSYGLKATVTSTTGVNTAIIGEDTQPAPYGGTGVQGTSTNGYGVQGVSTNGSAGYFRTYSASSSMSALYVLGGDYTTASQAIIARADGTNATTATITGTGSNSTGLSVIASYTGAVFAAQNTTGTSYGIRSSCASNNCTAVWAGAPSGQTALYASGNEIVSQNLTVYGTGYFGGYITKAGGGFRIDDPEAPETQYLNHGFVESDLMKNVYDDSVVLDANGNGTITMPSWYSKVNKNGRLFADDVTKTKVSEGRWLVKGKPGQVVDWFIIATRDDAWTRANQPPTHIKKAPSQVGKYMHPELFGKPASAAILH